MKPGQAAGNQALDLRRDFLFGKIDEVSAKPIGDDSIKSRLVDETAVDHSLDNGFSI